MADRSALSMIVAASVLLPMTPARAAPATRLTISVDSTMAEQAVALLENPALTAADARKLLALPATRATLKHAANLDPQVSSEGLVEALVAAAHHRPLPADHFHLPTTAERLGQVRTLLAALRKDPAALSSAVAGRLAEYMPADLALETQVCLVVGGGSDGFTMGGNTFYLALDLFSGEMSAVQLMTTHELYHLVQAAMARHGPARREREPRALALAHNLMKAVRDEGTASLVADPTRVERGGSWMEWMVSKYRRNLGHIELSFALVDTLFFRAMRDPQADGDLLYRIGFSGNMDSMAYYVGYRMAQVIDRERGRARLIELVRGDPVEFFREYRTVSSPSDPHFGAGLGSVVDLAADRP
jgi:hypothetical protein